MKVVCEYVGQSGVDNIVLFLNLVFVFDVFKALAKHIHQATYEYFFYVAGENLAKYLVGMMLPSIWLGTEQYTVRVTGKFVN